MSFRTVIAILPAITFSFAAAQAGAEIADDSACDLEPQSVESILLSAAKESVGGGARSWLRRKLVCENDLGCYHLTIEEPWQRTVGERPVVVVVHGFNSCPSRNQAMVSAVRAAGFPCGTFAYPNDYSIAACAQLLSSQLRQFGREHPGRRMILVCHSMGGLVARACIEDSLYDPGNVDRLIMIAPPNQGTIIARFAMGSDVWEHWLARNDGGPWQRWRDSVIDGLGEAADELCPDSEFLRELNGRPRNPRVAYTIILGTGAQMNEAEINWIRESIVGRLAVVPGARSGAARLERWLSDVDELVEGKGDGVVAVHRGQLPGVSDTLVMPFGHLSVTGEPSTDVIRQVQAAVLERLN